MNDNPPAAAPPSSPIGQIMGQARAIMPTCGECKYGISIGLQEPLQCHLNPPLPTGMLAGIDPRTKQPIVFHSTSWPRVQRQEPGCTHHVPKLVQ